MDEVPQPIVRSRCKRCRVTRADIVSRYVIISPAGKAHHGECGKTDCGKDATGQNWWWPL